MSVSLGELSNSSSLCVVCLPFAGLNPSDTTQGIINHAELVAEFAKALTDVGEVLPRAKLNAKLYQTDMMKEAVVGLYRHILLFLQKALEWYQFSPGRRAVSAIIRPFKTDLKNTIDEVKRCATVMEAVAGSCMKAELRDTHSMVRKFNNHINDMEARFTEPLATLTAKMDEGWRTIIGNYRLEHVHSEMNR